MNERAEGEGRGKFPVMRWHLRFQRLIIGHVRTVAQTDVFEVWRVVHDVKDEAGEGISSLHNREMGRETCMTLNKNHCRPTIRIPAVISRQLPGL